MERPVYLGIFGKHPAAADHLEDLGLKTAAMVAFKQQFYVAGVGDCLARSAWGAELTAGGPIPYDHCLLNVDAEGWIAARIVSSQDAAGRRQYPLVVCLHGTSHESLHAHQEIWALLNREVAAARAASTVAQLRETVSRTEGMDFPTTASSLPDRRHWLDVYGRYLDRVAHSISPTGSGLSCIRVPVGVPPATDVLLWMSFLIHFRRCQALTAIWRSAATFTDVLLAPPAELLLRRMFADESKIPLTTQVPLKISPETSEQVAATLASWLPASRLFPDGPSAEDDSFLTRLRRDLSGWWRS
ncbi:MAG TPA: hypothetical protein VGM54_03255 [Chthoniobacter sp.]